MCNLFGVSGTEPIRLNEYLKTFFSNSPAHPNGWGIAVFRGNEISIEKEPMEASKSNYLRERLKAPLEAAELMAHIRLATRGHMEYENCHPFVRRDITGRNWTMIHNGTVFHCPVLNKYIFSQQGQTDSERILLYIVDCIDAASKEKGGRLTEKERFSVVDKAVCEVAPQNKVNLILYDGSLFYVHKNCRKSLFQKKVGSSMLFSTVRLDREGWQDLPLTTLLAYKKGRLRFTGTNHGQEYIYDPKDMDMIYLDYSGL